MKPLLIAAILGATACGGRSGPPPEADAASVARAQAAAQALGPDLARMLLSEIQRNGPMSAVAVCADSAQAMTSAHDRDGLRVRRVGTRTRNPLNAPDSLETRLLAYLAEQKLSSGTLPDEVMEVAWNDATDGWELRYLRPITTLQFCLTCHGARDQIPSDVRTVLAERYPDDRAVDYAIGDLRGAVSVRVALPEAP